MTYRQLQNELRALRNQGLTTIKLNSKKSALQAEYDRIKADQAPQMNRQLATQILEIRDTLIEEVGRSKMNDLASRKGWIGYEQMNDYTLGLELAKAALKIRTIFASGNFNEYSVA
jgi:hypothetical protein